MTAPFWLAPEAINVSEDALGGFYVTVWMEAPDQFVVIVSTEPGGWTWARSAFASPERARLSAWAWIQAVVRQVEERRR